MSTGNQFRVLRTSIAHEYFTWLDKKGLISNLETPETTASFCYNRNLPETVNNYFESIFNFLSYHEILTEANGTYSLTHDLKLLREIWAEKPGLSGNSPVKKFMLKGLKILEDRMDGGSGTFDSHTDHYLLERVMTINEFHIEVSEEIDMPRVHHFFPHPRVGIYALFPQVCADFILNSSVNFTTLNFICPTDMIKNQTISYFELFERMRKMSLHVNLRRDIISSSLDFIFIPNGLYFNFDVMSQIKYFQSVLKKHGFLYFIDSSNPEFQIGFEPLLQFYPGYHKFERLESIEKLFKANGFSPITNIENSRYSYVQKE